IAPYPYTFHTWDPTRVIEIGCVTIEVFEVEHTVPAYAMRITGPNKNGTGTVTVTYSGDTDSCDGLNQAAEQADLFLCEAAFEEGRDSVRGIHLTGKRAGQAASEAAAKRLVLTHIPPWTSPATIRAEACTEFSGPVDIAAPGTQWNL